MNSDDIYWNVVNEYMRTGSVKKTAENVGTTLVRAQRILITEGLWASETSNRVGTLYRKNYSTAEIAKELFLSEKTVQAYLPYTRTKSGYGGELRSNEAIRSEDYRFRMAQAAQNQIKETTASEELSQWRKEQIAIMNNRSEIPYEELNIISDDELSKKREELDQKICKETDLDEVLTISELYQNHMKKEPEVVKLSLELDTDDLKKNQISVLKKYGRVKEHISREVLVPADMTLHALHYVIQRLFGWQNSHLHQFLLPSDIFQKITGGKNKTDQYGYVEYDGKFVDWADLCGVYFRFPCEDFEDLYWDDDYREGQSFKSWLKRKYIGPYHYYGEWEHYLVANDEAMKLIRENPNIRVNISFREFEELRASGKLNDKNRTKTLPIKDVTIDEIGRGFTGRLDELLERLTLRELLIPSGVQADKELTSKIMELGDKQKTTEDELPVIPVTDTLLYAYDFGDNWKVKITLEECYYTKDKFDTAEEGNLDGYIMMGSDEYLLESAKAYNRHNVVQDEEITEKIIKTAYKKKPICLSIDGLCLMDDVGGVHGYTDFLMTIKEGDPDEKEGMLTWAKGMGWNGRMFKPENML